MAAYASLSIAGPLCRCQLLAGKSYRSMTLTAIIVQQGGPTVFELASAWSIQVLPKSAMDMGCVVASHNLSFSV